MRSGVLCSRTRGGRKDSGSVFGKSLVFALEGVGTEGQGKSTVRARGRIQGGLIRKSRLPPRSHNLVTLKGQPEVTPGGGKKSEFHWGERNQREGRGRRVYAKRGVRGALKGLAASTHQEEVASTAEKGNGAGGGSRAAVVDVGGICPLPDRSREVYARGKGRPADEKKTVADRQEKGLVRKKRKKKGPKGS